MKDNKTILFLFIIALMLALPARAQDEMPGQPAADKAATAAAEPYVPKSMASYLPSDEIEFEESDYDAGLELTIGNLRKVLERYNIKFQKIVLAQALLETGYFSSDVCRYRNNLFGLRRPSDGSYYIFDNWQESVKAYADYVQYKYRGGDYYAFLDRIGYAEDRYYISKVRRIAMTL